MQSFINQITLRLPLRRSSVRRWWIVGWVASKGCCSAVSGAFAPARASGCWCWRSYCGCRLNYYYCSSCSWSYNQSRYCFLGRRTACNRGWQRRAYRARSSNAAGQWSGGCSRRSEPRPLKGSSGSQARTGPVGRRVHSPASVRGAPNYVQVSGATRAVGEFKGTIVGFAARKSNHVAASGCRIGRTAKFPYCSPRFYFVYNGDFFRYFYSTNTRVFFESQFSYFYSFFSSRVPLGKLTRNPFTTKIAGSSFCSCLEYYFCYERGKISRNLFLSSRDEPACFTKLNSRFFWLERKNIKIFGPHRIASCCIIVLLVWLDDSFFRRCVYAVFILLLFGI